MSAMRSVSRTELTTVVGAGESSTTIRGPGFSYTSTKTDYQACVDATTRSTAAQYPSTNPWWKFWGTDANAGPRAAATLDNLRTNCGPPPR